MTERVFQRFRADAGKETCPPPVTLYFLMR
jgi:hypothetical protein